MINTTLQGDGYKKQMSMPHRVILGAMLIICQIVNILI